MKYPMILDKRININSLSFLILRLMIASNVCKQKNVFTSTLLNAWQTVRYRSFMTFMSPYNITIMYSDIVLKVKKERRMIQKRYT